MLATGLFAFGCSSKKSPAKDDAALPDDAPSIDAPVIPACANPVNGTTVTLRKLADKVNGGAMLVTSPPNDTRLFVVEQTGAIRIFDNEHLLPTPFLDISANAQLLFLAGGELGLLGLAFDPQYATNGELYIWYTARGPSNTFTDVLARYHVSASDPNKADPAGTIVLSIPDPYSNHNGGMLEFGADGYLYVGTGDGGSGGDPQNRAQNPNELLGKFLRLDVHNRPAGKEYGIPPTNPYAGGGGAPEVLMLGLRNPWRWSFDRMTGDMWIADVGQNKLEELDVIKAADINGAPGKPLNLGWNIWEANQCYPAGGTSCDATGKVFPLDVRTHVPGNWHAIIGGQVYRGTCYPDIQGWYFYTDNTNSGLTKARLKVDGTLDIVDLTGTFPTSPASLHADARGELYETDTGGNIYHVEAGP